MRGFFTIRKLYTDRTITKYRTTPMSKDEFRSNEYNTEGDWKNFLRNTDDYYLV